LPGTLTFDNTRITETSLFWGSDADETQVLLGWYLSDDRDTAPPTIRGEERLTDLPAAPEGPLTLDDLSSALGERFARHPLANQLAGATKLVEGSLAAGAPPLDVARIAARHLCPGGIVRALGYALSATAPGPFRGATELSSIRALAHACQLVRLGTLECLGKDGRPWFLERLPSWASNVPRYPDFRTHHGATIGEACLEHDRLQSKYLRDVASRVESVLALAPEELTPEWELELPSQVRPPEEARERVDALFANGDTWTLFFAAKLRDALREMHGLPLREVRAQLTTMMLGRCPAPRPEGAEDVTPLLAEGTFAFAALDVIRATDRDLTGLLREREEAKAALEAKWAEKRRLAAAAAPTPAPTTPSSLWLAALTAALRFFGF
jgi:hypothetical protein